MLIVGLFSEVFYEWLLNFESFRENEMTEEGTKSSAVENGEASVEKQAKGSVGNLNWKFLKYFLMKSIQARVSTEKRLLSLVPRASFVYSIRSYSMQPWPSSIYSNREIRAFSSSWGIDYSN